MQPILPTGTVTFLMTDVEGSTALWETEGEAMALAMELHDELAARIVSECRGHLLKERGEGDALFAVFERASEAVEAAVLLQLAWSSAMWPTARAFRVRMALHCGETWQRSGDYYGPVVNRCARIRAIGHGGQVLLSEAVANLVRECLPEQTSLVELGPHRLKDLARPERVYRLAHPELLSEFAPLRSLDDRLHNLPVYLTNFLGRDQEVQVALGCLNKARLLSLVGIGGAGKTRLSVQIAAECLESFPDGVWFVDFSAVSDPNWVGSALAAAMGLVIPPSASQTSFLAESLREKRMLLVLDNCEHLTEAIAGLVGQLLSASAGLKILATSRQPLHVPGEQIFPVPPMPLPALGERDEAKLLESGAGRLFLDRARQAVPQLVLSPHAVEAIAEVCWQVDGIPLALELAAARLRAMSPVQLRDRLRATLDVLSTTGAGVQERHRKLRATLDWSYNLLSKDKQSLFVALAMFEGGWTLESAEAVCAGAGVEAEDVLDLNEALVDRSLVQVDAGLGGEVRFRMLESVHTYAREKLATSPYRAELEDRFVTWAASLTAQEEHLDQGDTRVAWLGEMDRELDNLRHAIQLGMGGTNRGPDALTLLTQMHTYWVSRGRFAEAESWLAKALAALPNADALERARAVNLLGVSQMMQGKLSLAVATLNEALELRRQLDDLRGQAAVLSNLGMVQRSQGDSAAAREAFAASVALFEALSDPWSRAYAELNLGCAELDLGNLEVAAAAFGSSQRYLEKESDNLGLSFLMVALADLHHAQGRKGAERSVLERGLKVAMRVGAVTPIAEALVRAARLLAEEGCHWEAAMALLAGIGAFAESGTVANLAQQRAWQELEVELRDRLGDAWEAAHRDANTAGREGLVTATLEALSRLRL